MSLNCEVCVGGNYGFDIADYESSIQTTESDIECRECGRIITANQEYEHVTGLSKDEDRPVEYDTCLDCMNIALGLSCGRRVHTTLWSELECDEDRDEAAFNSFSQACVGKVETASAKAYLVERWMKWKGLT